LYHEPNSWDIGFSNKSSQLNNLIHILYPHGALGHTMLELFNYCTAEGNRDSMQLLHTTLGHQHHLTSCVAKTVKPYGKILTHDEYNIYPNLVVSTANTMFGKLLIKEMGYIKAEWGRLPTLEDPTYTTFRPGVSLGEKYESVAVGLLDDLNNPGSWYHNNNCPQFNIEWYWQSTDKIEGFLQSQGLTPLTDRVMEFAKTVQEINKRYYNKVEYYFKLQNEIVSGIDKNIELKFYEIIIVYALLLSFYQKKHTECKIFTTHPKNTLDFYNLFN